LPLYEFQYENLIIAAKLAPVHLYSREAASSLP
jgi:hypothetical protein